MVFPNSEVAKKFKDGVSQKEESESGSSIDGINDDDDEEECKMVQP